ncbi:unnamed protein product [Meloidogyne enterolobii]|uniref:Uncharacterized protein n=1 Tax=Meloidogyne enterolobii TaxID=390850 RepID=A0ACB1A0G9_MELEN
MLKFLIILTCLIIKTHSWTWQDYPSPRGPDYWKCGVAKPAWVCDPDGMLTDQQREEIVQLVEDFKEKTRRPNSKFLCMPEGLRLVVALSKSKIDPRRKTSSGYTELCTNDRNWTASDRTECESRVHGIELNTDGLHNCAQIYFFWRLYDIDYEKLNREVVRIKEFSLGSIVRPKNFPLALQ